ncbi:GMC family oxidoreductase [Aspergillus lucknowensis]|uniref:Glucose-methanol-choline oxidoreductase N-terminal domain-containing protein n=1 Tax=Aspergillus lucknowensis TaxID=176173 RepID=A0ABR4LSF2_9EURO
MPLYTELPPHVKAVDILVAGGGTAGCIVASRLADTDPNLSILVLEAGPNGAGNPLVDYPAFFFGNLHPTSSTATFYKSSKPDMVVPTAKVLGGGSAINMMQYSRAQREDWDSWQTPGWSADEILPFARKLETYHGPGAKEVHGSDGPIHVSAGTFVSRRFQDGFVSAADQLGWPEANDLSGFDDRIGVQRALRYTSPDGKRQDTASRYLRPRLEDGKHPNLHVAVESRVVKLLVENGKVTGVVYRPKGDDNGIDRTVLVRRQVVVSAGAFGTPAILERSGIGNPDVLKRAGITEVVADVPGVGHGYQDHNLLIYTYKSALDPEETLDALNRGSLDPEELIKDRHRILGWNGQDATSKIRPNQRDIDSFDSKLKELWNKDYASNPNKPLMIMAPVCLYPAQPDQMPPGQSFALTLFTVYPLSRGHVHITGRGLDDPVDFNAGFFSDPNGIDVKKHRWAYKKQREIARRIPVFRGEYPENHPAFPAASKAAVIDHIEGPPDTEIQDVEYSAADDAAIDDFVRKNVGSTWHSLGTCRMAPREEDGVVDASLSVYGVQGLKVADLSIVPRNVAANTNNTALVIGEKAADILIKELGLGTSSSNM